MGVDIEMGEIRMEEDDEVAFRDEVERLGDDMEIDIAGKEKPKDSGKHRSKDGKKGRHEDRDHRSRVREKSERDDADLKMESDRYDTTDRDRNDVSRERRKEDRSDYGKDKEREKERERYKERSKDKIEDRDREKYRERERDKDRVKERDREKVQVTGSEHDKGRDHEKDKGKDREKTRELDRGRDQIQDEDWRKERDRERSKGRERDYDKDGQKYLEREREKEKDREKVKDKDREREREREREKDRARHKDREKLKDNEKDKEYREKDKERDKSKEKYRDKEMDRSSEKDRDKSRSRDKAKATIIGKDERAKDGNDDGGVLLRKGVQDDSSVPEETGFKNHPSENPKEPQPSSELQERLKKMKEDRMKRKTEGASEILSWVSRSRKLEEKKVIEVETSHPSKTQGQDDVLEGSDEDEVVKNNQKELAGVKILHGIDKVMEGGAVVLTLKDQNILADGDVNEEIDMLENVEIGQQKQRDEAYRAAKKKTGLYDDKFNDDLQPRRSILPQYDDPVEDEGVELDESGQFTGEAEKKLEDLRKRLEGRSVQRNYEDLSTAGRVSSDYYTPEEMIQFKKPKKKKSIRKREKLDLDALEAEAISSGLGSGDRGSRNDMRRQAVKEEEERIEAEKRSNAYQAAYNKAEEASKMLRQEQTLVVNNAEEDDLVFGEDYEDLQRSLDQSRKIALKKQEEVSGSGPQAIALLVTAKEQDDNQSSATGEPQEKQVVITEMEEFVLGLQFNEDHQIPQSEDVFMDNEDDPEPEPKDDIGSDLEETNESELPLADKEDEDVTPDEIIHEVPVGKGLSGALKLLKDRGTLNETIDLGGRNMDKKKSKLVGLYDNQGQKEIRIERTDEFGRVMTPKEAFRMLSHKFHGKGPGKMKQEKRMKQYQEDLKRKQMKASDTPLLAMERMREAQAQLQQPYLVLSGHVKPGQTSDPRSGFATVEKDHFGSLTPMLGDKKVEHFLGIKRKPDAANLPPLPPKKPKS